MTTYWQRLADRTNQRGTLCVGIDPMPGVLDAWGLAARDEMAYLRKEHVAHIDAVLRQREEQQQRAGIDHAHRMVAAPAKAAAAHQQHGKQQGRSPLPLKVYERAGQRRQGICLRRRS